jgi:hypothetical protein
MRYSRLIVLLSISFTCVAVNFWLVTTGHYRLPLFIFLGCIFLIAYLLRRLPPITTETAQTRTNQLKAASSFRRLGFLFAGGLVLNVINMISGGFKELPTWANVLLFCWGGFLTCACFWAARHYKNGAAEDESFRSAEPKQ